MIKCYKTAHIILYTQQYVIKCICNSPDRLIYALLSSSGKRKIKKKQSGNTGICICLTTAHTGVSRLTPRTAPLLGRVTPHPY